MKVKRSVIRDVINRNFTFADLSKRFKNVDSSTGNIFCPFHENHSTPAAKMYWDEDRQIWIIHCFGQCHRNFTAYDYVELILCKKYERYKDPMEFLRINMGRSDLSSQLKISSGNISDLSENFTKRKIEYINNVFAANENTEDYIERLYLA